MTRPIAAAMLISLATVFTSVDAHAQSASAQSATADKPAFAQTATADKPAFASSFAQDASASALRAMADKSADKQPDGFIRFQVAGGLGWTGGYPIGESSADLIQNAPGQSPPAFTLFRASSSFESAPSVEARFGVTLAPRVMIEVGGAFSRPNLRVEISDDAEAGDLSFDGETISQYIVDVSLVWELPVPATARVRPFAIGGGGYLRQLHDDRSLVETGQLYHVGGGARVFFRGAASGHPFGVRGDVQAAFRRDGIELEGERRVMPTASLLVFFGF